MKFLDNILQQWRIRKASKWIPSGARVLDIGCYQGELFEWLGDRIGLSIGIDPLAPKIESPQYKLIPLEFTEPLLFPDAEFDVITLIATLEHFFEKEALVRKCGRLLKPGGRVIITVPDPFVDKIIEFLVILRIFDGMSLEQHHGYDPNETPAIFSPSFTLEKWSKFQLGLNNLFVLKRQ